MCFTLLKENWWDFLMHIKHAPEFLHCYKMSECWSCTRSSRKRHTVWLCTPVASSSLWAFQTNSDWWTWSSMRSAPSRSSLCAAAERWCICVWLLIVCSLSKLELLIEKLHDALFNSNSLPLSTPQCAFSHGGHMFAAVNGNVIHVYSVTSFDNILNLKGHNGKVSQI